jgi:hypothetical protein
MSILSPLPPSITDVGDFNGDANISPARHARPMPTPAHIFVQYRAPQPSLSVEMRIVDAGRHFSSFGSIRGILRGFDFPDISSPEAYYAAAPSR